MTVTDFWSPLNGLAYTPEPVPCRSRWFLRGEEGVWRSLTCGLNADHTGAGLDGRHGLYAARWTDDMVVKSRVEYLASAGPDCSEGCGRQVEIRGRCQPCENREQAADNYETTESEAA